MTSQIQPHFIYNTLSAIKSLIRVDPKIAIETVSDFSKYLRGNIDSLSITKPVSFKDELKHVETYLSIEQKRFRNKLNITYNISVWDFDLPALSVQPIVENAVRHGITSSKENGGNITISVHEINDEIILTITDDGVGFDTTKASNKQEKVNVGLKNVRTRLAAMVGGKLDVQSEVNIGTTVTIIIPMGGAIPAGGTIPAGRTIPMRGAISRKE
jgi:LytS/YehU family sensor histidine kinase